MCAHVLTTVATVSTRYELFRMSIAIMLRRTTAETAQWNNTAILLLQHIKFCPDVLDDKLQG